MRSPFTGRSRKRLAGPSRRRGGASTASMTARVGCSHDVVAAKSWLRQELRLAAACISQRSCAAACMRVL